ncbi:MAG: ABC transporter ATP-binding protein [Erysipelotrichaceae bacterium]|jgi:branched-chain amino acid transport system ATP-binding protein|nr:ABC transporter ATP-binding protein [Erysipelotrichaceae bacterium]
MLEIKNLSVSYGGIKALKSISITVPDKKIVTLIGANGAGKSTTLRAIAKLIKHDSGTIIYNGEDITAISARETVQKGITLIPEGRHVFPDMTVLENLKLGAFLRTDNKAIKEDIDYMYELFPVLKERSTQLAGTLSGGEQQMLAVSRALMARPKMLMMDEPSLGLAPMLVKDIFTIIERVNREDGLPILLIEQNANFALKVADYGYVLETGTIQLEGTGEQLLENEKVKELYLGTGD